MPSFTFVATAHALRWIRGSSRCSATSTPRRTPSTRRASSARSPRGRRAIIGVHLWGRRLRRSRRSATIAARHGLALLFDAAHAIGCSHGRPPIGELRRRRGVQLPRHEVLNAVEGGAIITDDDELGGADAAACATSASRARTSVIDARHERQDERVCGGDGPHVARAHRRRSSRSTGATTRPTRRARRDPGLRARRLRRRREPHNFQYVVARGRPGACDRLPRDDLVAALHAENVLARRYFYPGCHRMEPYRRLSPQRRPSLPVTERPVATACVVLPTGTAVGAEEIAQICAIVRRAVDEAPAIRAAVQR